MVTEMLKWNLSLAYGTIKLFHFNYSHLFHFSSFFFLLLLSQYINKNNNYFYRNHYHRHHYSRHHSYHHRHHHYFVVGCLVLEVNWWLMPIHMQSISYAINNVALRPIHQNRRIHVSHTQQIWGGRSVTCCVSVTVLQMCKHVTMQF